MNEKVLDRINLAYNGELGEDMQHNTQTRVSWMCNNVLGKSVLDIGCSQGIVSLVLGREEKSVTGIDIAPEQISYAQQELELEDISVRKNISFICADFLGFEFGTETYDTIIMGEFLEHVFDPMLYLNKAAALLNENGRLIVTVPFGINPFPDHKRTYYFLELYQQIDKLIHVDSIRMFGCWIGFVADKRLKESKVRIDTELVALLENAFFVLDEGANNKIKSLMTSIENYANKRKEMETQLLQLNKQNDEKENRLNENANQIGILKEKIATLDSNNKEIQKRFENMNRTAYSTKKELNLLIQKNAETQKELAELHEREEENEKALEERNETIKRMRTEINQLKIANQQGERLIGELKEKEKLLAERKETIETLNLTINKLKASNLQLSKKFEEMNHTAYSGKRKIRFLQQENEKLQERYLFYKTSYNRLFNLRGIQIWMKGRKLVGKPYKIESDDDFFSAISPDIVEKSNNPIQQKQIITAAEKKKAYEEKSTNQEFYNNIEALTKEIKDSNGSGYYKKAEINVGIITDDFMYNYYKDAVNLSYLSPDNYQDIIDNYDLDMVLFVSCWHGMFGQEDYSGDAKRNKILEILDYAKEKNITSVFQTIEDPTNYTTFIKIAKATDIIFTSDINMIEKYKKDTGNDNVFVLGYGINPQFHNPIGSLKKRNSESVLFAGSWTERYPNRCRDMEMLFRGVIGSKDLSLIIADRNMDINGYQYPDMYTSCLIPPIKHDLLQKVHKLFDYCLNVNTITDSPTMCAMRVYELQALGNLLISNYSLASSNTFPGIFNVFSSDEIEKILRGYDREEKIEMQLEGIREVFSNYTVYNRLNYIFDKVKIPYQYPEKKVYILYKNLTENIKSSFERQNYRQKELCSIEMFIGLDRKDGFFIIFNDALYVDNYVLDLVNATKYTDTNYIVYCDYLNTKDAFDFTSYNNTVEETLYNAEKVNIEEVLSHKSFANGFAIPYLELDRDLGNCKKEIAVIIPVYNNGKYLKERALRSLQRSSVFEKMQLYIIDDGSDDGWTISIIKELEKKYSNITTFFYDGEKSGSASRPRNKGVEIAKEPFIAFLDPDNEAINDGYALLFKDIKEKKVDFAFGDVTKVGSTIQPLCFEYEDKLIEEPREELIVKKFKTSSIQACIIRSELIKDNHITNPEGAIGQDTMFFYELMLNASRAYHRYLPIHIYYAQRESSVVNSIGKQFFDKSFIMEKYQSETLKKYNILEEYKEIKFNQFFNDWYMEKLNNVKEEEKEDCLKIINKIADFYG